MPSDPHSERLAPAHGPVRGISRRTLLHAALVGGGGLALGRLPCVRAAQQWNSGSRPLPVTNPLIVPPTMGNPGTMLQHDRGPLPPVSWSPTPNYNSIAASSSGAGSLSSITSVLFGSGLYIGNEFEYWTETQMQTAFEQIRSWGFHFICPKVGGYGETWYTSDSQLQQWRTWAIQVGLGFVPFIYSVPSSYSRDADICSEIANDCGIVVVDMESEWESSSGEYNSDMAGFGTEYLKNSANIPIVVTGYGDPTYAFSGWPYSEMAAWAAGYSPQWYYGEWAEYNSYGVVSGVNWGDNFCAEAFGNNFPMIPSVSVYSAYASSGYLPNSDIAVGANYTSLWKAPVIWWEYGGMTASRAAACLG